MTKNLASIVAVLAKIMLAGGKAVRRALVLCISTRNANSIIRLSDNALSSTKAGN